MQVLSEIPLPWLDGPVSSRHPPAVVPGFSSRSVQLAALLLDQPVQVCVDHQPTGSLLGFADGTTLWLDAAGQRLELCTAGAHWLAIVIGPGLLLALARRGRWCWHASAFRLPDGRCWLALAPSGTGKSTLARSVLAQGGLRLADDLAVVGPDGPSVQIWPRVPQLKLSAEQHWPAAAAAALPVDGVALIARGVSPARVRLHESRLLLRALLGHSVASRLYDPATLARHFEFCATTAETWVRTGVAERWLAASSTVPEAAWQAVWQGGQWT